MTIRTIRNEAQILHLPFARLCSVSRACLAVFEMRKFVGKYIVGEDECKAFKKYSSGSLDDVVSIMDS
jgi:hypothetical protein